jgi:hypothetical protein
METTELALPSPDEIRQLHSGPLLDALVWKWVHRGHVQWAQLVWHFTDFITRPYVAHHDTWGRPTKGFGGPVQDEEATPVMTCLPVSTEVGQAVFSTTIFDIHYGDRNGREVYLRHLKEQLASIPHYPTGDTGYENGAEIVFFLKPETMCRALLLAVQEIGYREPYAFELKKA